MLIIMAIGPGLFGSPTKEFHIYLSEGMDVVEKDIKLQQRQFACTINSCCMTHALEQATVDNPDYKGHRTAGVGDMIMCDNAFYLITNDGFEHLCDVPQE